MFFTRIGRVVSHLIFWAGALRLAIAVWVAVSTPDMETNAALSRRYLATSTSGEAIDGALTYLMLGLALGILSEIGARLRN